MSFQKNTSVSLNMEVFRGKEFIQVCKVSFVKAWSMSRKSGSLILPLKIKNKKTDYLIQHLVNSNTILLPAGIGIRTNQSSNLQILKYWIEGGMLKL